MDTDDQTRLHAERCRLEAELLVSERLFEALGVLTGQAERARLATQMQAQLAELAVINTRLSALRGPAAT